MVSVKGKAGLTRTWGETDQDTRTTQTDASRERRESHGTTTNINRMYNLLTGYHPGTNRAVFLMLPRPHILQPTERRTLVQGLRYIEGVQDFFLIVSHAKNIDGMCIEALLETGHFPSSYRPPEPQPEYEESHEDFVVTACKSGSYNAFADTKAKIENDPSSTHRIQEGWVIDKRPFKGDSGHPGILEGTDHSNRQAKDSLRPGSYNYQAIDDSTVQVQGEFHSSNAPTKHDARFERDYRVLLRRAEPLPSSAVLPTPFFLTARGLCACVQWEKECPRVLSIANPGKDASKWDSVVQESTIQISAALLGRELAAAPRTPALRELLRSIQAEMVTSWRRPSRHTYGEMGFLDTDYFKNRIKALLPRDILERKLEAVEGLPASVAQALGENCTLDEALKLDLKSLMRKTGLSARAAADARRLMLGLKPAAIGPKWDRARDSAVVKREESRPTDKGK